MAKNKKSVLRDIMDDVYAATTYDYALSCIKKHLESPDSPIRESEGRMIIIKAEQCSPNLIKLQSYITNSWFKYEGMGV